MEDSKTRASFIAESMGQKIIGIKSLQVKGSGRQKSICLEDDEMDYHMEFGDDEYEHSNSLQAPVTKRSSCVDVVWIIE